MPDFRNAACAAPPAQRHPAFYGALTSYLVLVLAFAARAPKPLQYCAAAAGFAFGIWLMRSSLAESVLLIVLVTHIGPIVQLDTGFAGSANIGDLFVFACFGAALIRWFRQPPRRPSRLVTAFLLLAAFVAVAYVFTPDHVAALPPLINLAEFFIAYFLVWTELRDRDQIRRLLGMIAVTVLLSGCLHLFFYVQGVSMSLATESGRELVQSGALLKVDMHSMRYFQKTTFFYPTFVASCAACAALCLSNLLLPRKLEAGRSLFYGLVLAVCIAEGLVQGSRTILATASICALMIFWRMRRLKAQTALTRLVFAGIALSAAVIAGYWLQQRLLSDPQRSAFSQMLVEDAPVSWNARVEIWKSIASRCLLYPKELLVGLGPDVPLRGSHVERVAAITYIPSLGTNVPSFHNFYVDLLFQFGLAGFIVFAITVARTMVQLRRLSIRTADSSATSCLFALAAWLVLWNSHATTWTKPTLVFAVLMGAAHGLLALQPGRALCARCALARRWTQHCAAAVEIRP